MSLALDLFPLLAVLLAAASCGLLGNFLVLRRMSLMGDAISHAVLPGIVLAFLVQGTRAPAAMLIGAAIAGVVTVLLVEAVRRYGRVESGAAMGVVFSLLFATGVLLIESAALRHVDLDASCVLHGQLETLIWYDAPATAGALWQRATLEAVPPSLWLLAIVLVLVLGFVVLLFKELRITTFDPSFAAMQGLPVEALRLITLALVAIATVAAFEAVGSILVIALLVAPAAAARLWTDDLARQLGLSLAVATVASVLGYALASALPHALGLPSVNAAGSIGCVLGLVVMASVGLVRARDAWRVRMVEQRHP